MIILIYCFNKRCRDEAEMILLAGAEEIPFYFVSANSMVALLQLLLWRYVDVLHQFALTPANRKRTEAVKDLIK